MKKEINHKVERREVEGRTGAIIIFKEFLIDFHTRRAKRSGREANKV